MPRTIHSPVYIHHFHWLLKQLSINAACPLPFGLWRFALAVLLAWHSRPDARSHEPKAVDTYLIALATFPLPPAACTLPLARMPPFAALPFHTPFTQYMLPFVSAPEMQMDAISGGKFPINATCKMPFEIAIGKWHSKMPLKMTLENAVGNCY